MLVFPLRRTGLPLIKYPPVDALDGEGGVGAEGYEVAAEGALLVVDGSAGFGCVAEQDAVIIYMRVVAVEGVFKPPSPRVAKRREGVRKQHSALFSPERD